MMKKIAILLIFVSCAAYAVQQNIQSWNFFAPHVADEQDLNGVLNPGDIVYDKTENKFYGKTGGGNSWAEFGAGSSGSVPTGTILPYVGSGSVPPAGFLFAEGGTVSRTTYAELYAAVGDAFGEGDGTTTFHLPDLRGRFLRGMAGAESTSRDPDVGARTSMNIGGNIGNNIGTLQDHAFQGHHHGLYGIGNNTNPQGGANITQISGTTPNGVQSHATAVQNPINGNHGNINVSTETRPVNVYVRYIIKI